VWPGYVVGRHLHYYSERMVCSGWVCDVRYYYYCIITVREVVGLLGGTPTVVVMLGVGVVIFNSPYCCMSGWV
jgi:hypothetical protein